MKHIFSFFTIIAICLLVGFMYFYSQIRVDISTIIDYKPKLTTQIFDRNGNLVANIFDEENRHYAQYDEIPQRVIESLIAIEDTSFFEHGGINVEAIFRAAIKDIKAMALVEGASTITQQLIKNMVLTRDKKFTRKLREIILAIKIEDELTKEQIIERYLNQVYFGHGYYGIKTAALGYFKKSLNELSLKEIAMLVGLPKAPSNYDPTRHMDLSISRANGVISRLFNLGWITQDEYEASLKETPIVFDETLTQNRAPYLVDEAIKEAIKHYPDIKYGGYKVTLTADLKIQDIAQNALKFGYTEILKRDKNADEAYLNGAIIVTNPTNGEILALVGGVDYAKSNFNRATQSERQPGSSFKPFIYQIALDLGYSPMSKVADISRVFENVGRSEEDRDWKPKNYSGNFEGYITLKDALKQSRNLATINLLNSIGLDIVSQKLSNFGFKNIPQNLSIALGSFGISLIEFSQHYSMFAGLGTTSKSNLIKSIQKDEVITEFSSEQTVMIKPEQAYLMIDMLKTVVEEGTGRGAKVAGIEIAGKTGTTNNNIDAWFCGFTPEVQAIIWYGNDNNMPMRKIEGGGRTAAPVFREFIQNYIKEFPDTKRKFDTPKEVYHKIYEGNDAIYTDTSPLPKQQINAIDMQEGGLIF
ncbi:transglycosylase domain-containing protein [Campylobacter hyointestinalis]|uniref:transglycosylase domain-containing protein n=1 Tax=Campylobacter hyointestinalis TaxID=198 RepID=UPI000DCE8BC4|nr:PBP1A family penicillin-binding protein [Campylobacter hyointestinalis]RAZ55226.1 penicillin-binding protein [Campylobacter hyointestinalis subsp. lawsonii]RAZ64185.1 penicillin-binding protein [Campylobacter hyointestinalis subsp. lawsonii]